MERKRLEATIRTPKPALTVAGNRARLSRALRTINHIDAASMTRRPTPAGGA